jgi:phospholipid transport system substrate-binding protein
MSRRASWLKVGLIAIVLCFGPSPRVMAQTPKLQLQGTIDHVMKVLGTIRSADDIAKNKGRLEEILLTRFDFTEMARRSLGSQWNNLNGKEQEFVSAFMQFIENSYLGRLGSYRGEKIVYGSESVEQDFADVNTQVVGGQGPAIDVRYRLHLIDAEWKVYDVVIDQVSLVANYRSQFDRVLQTASLEELLRRLRAKGSGHQS